jgi:RNA polymerase sigma-70 factor (ECF subfamily)
MGAGIACHGKWEVNHARCRRQDFSDRIDSKLACTDDTRWQSCGTLRIDERYRSQGCPTAFSILKNREDAEDALQEASFHAFLKFSTFEGNSAFSTWFIRIVISTCLMQMRKHRAHPTYSLDEMLAEGTCSSYQLPSKNPPLEQECRCTELHSLVHTTVSALPTRLRHVAEDRFYEELSLNALAEKRGISTTAAKSRLFRARGRLSEALIQGKRDPSRKK